MVLLISLTIIIPHYNSAESLKKLLLSIPKISEVEVIVIDDHSDEGLSNYYLLIDCDRFNNVIFLNNGINKKGAGACRNIGLKKATGKWVLFADADDYFIDGFYETIKKYFDSTSDVVFFIPTSVEADSDVISHRHKKYEEIIKNHIQKNDNRSELQLRYKMASPWSKMIRASFINENKITFDEILASNDVVFSAKVGFYMNSFEVSSETIYCITRSKGSLTVNTSEKVFDARLDAYIRYCIFLRSNLSSRELKQLNLRGAGFLYLAFIYGLGLKKVISTYKLLKNAQVKIFDFQYLNPLYILSKVAFHLSRYWSNRGLFTK